MNPKIFALTFGALLFAICLPAEAQEPKKVRRIGVLAVASHSSQAARYEAFRQGLRELGYVEGKNILIEYRSAEGKPDRVPELASELVRANVDCIITAGTTVTRAARHATTTIPIIMTTVGDPIGAGLVASLARPGGNVTGLTDFSTDLAGKRLELIKEVIPKLASVAILSDAETRGTGHELRDTEAAAQQLGVQPQSLEVRGLNEFERAFGALTKGRTGALLVLSSGRFNTHRQRIVELAAKHSLASMYPQEEYVLAGGLMSYTTNIPDLYRRASTSVDKILKGAKPVDLPVEQPMKFELVINLKTAKQIGLIIPPNVLARADKVIR
jgi:putative ABC transport system substrate-binding protein